MVAISPGNNLKTFEQRIFPLFRGLSITDAKPHCGWVAYPTDREVFKYLNELILLIK